MLSKALAGAAKGGPRRLVNELFLVSAGYQRFDAELLEKPIKGLAVLRPEGQDRRRAVGLFGVR